MTYHTTPLLALLMLAMVPTGTAQKPYHLHGPQPPNINHCPHEEDNEQECSDSRDDQRRMNIEDALLQAETRRMQAETRMLNAQRAIAREEQRRIQAERQAALSAAKQQEWKYWSADVMRDELTNNIDRYHSIVLTSVTGINTKHTVEQASEILSAPTGLEFINPLKIKRKYRTHRKLPADFIHRPGVLQAQIHREKLNEYGRFVRLVVRNHLGKVVYDARYENVHFGEMLAPLQGVASRR